MVSISEDISGKSIVQAITIAHSQHYTHPLKEALEAPLMAPTKTIGKHADYYSTAGTIEGICFSLIIDNTCSKLPFPFCKVIKDQKQ